MPKTMILKTCDVKTVDFHPIIALAKTFCVSLTAAAIKFVRFCPEACAVVLCRDKKICWSYHSETWFPYIKHGVPLGKQSLAYDFFVGKTMHEDPEEVPASAWFDHDDIDEVVEHSIASKEFSSVLSLLWLKP